MKKWHKITLSILSVLIIAVTLAVVFWPPALRVQADEYMILLQNYMNMASPDNPVELIDQRTESSKKFSLGGSSYAIEATIGAIHYKNDRKDESEAWKDIDTAILWDGVVYEAPYDLQVYLTGMPGFHYVSKESGEFEVRIAEARQNSLSLTPIPSSTKVTPVIDGNTVTWHDLYPDVDVVLTAFNTGVSLNRIIKSPSAPSEYDVEITELEKGVAQLMPLKPATDAEGQLIKMEEEPTLNGRTETLKLEVIEQEGIEVKPITYPIRDSTIIDDQEVAQNSDDAYEDPNENVISSTLDSIRYISGTGSWVGGFRWVLSIAQSSTIDVAYAQINLYGTSYDDANMNLYFQYAAAPVTFDIGYPKTDITDRPINTTPASWTSLGLGTGYKQTPSLVTPLQEVIDDFSVTSIALIAYPKTDTNYWFRYLTKDYGDPPLIYIEYTEGGGDPSLTNTPSSKAFGVVADSSTFWSNGSEPSWPLTDGDAYFTITNDGSIEIDINIDSTDFDGGGGWNLVTGSPGAGEVRLLVYKEGDGSTDNITILNTQTLFISSLAASANTSWELRMDVPTVSDKYQHSANITLEASAS